tara:strand:- start:2592 stop:2963 length:372 start_codon:yes stop_codon:yes gene_type:complete
VFQIGRQVVCKNQSIVGLVAQLGDDLFERMSALQVDQGRAGGTRGGISLKRAAESADRDPAGGIRDGSRWWQQVEDPGAECHQPAASTFSRRSFVVPEFVYESFNDGCEFRIISGPELIGRWR